MNSYTFLVLLYVFIGPIGSCENGNSMEEPETKSEIDVDLSDKEQLQENVKQDLLHLAHKKRDGDTEVLVNIASRKMIELLELVMHTKQEESEELPHSRTIVKHGKGTKRNITSFSAYTECPTPADSIMVYTKFSTSDDNAINASTGVYTVKTPGLYGFIFHAKTNDLNTTLPTAELRVNGVTVATAAAYNGETFKALTLIAGSRLKEDDTVYIFVSGGSLFAKCKNNKNRASFAGTLMN